MHRLRFAFGEKVHTPKIQQNDHQSTADSLYQYELRSVENTIRSLIWENATLYEDDEDIRSLLQKKADIEHEFEICHKEDLLDKDVEYIQTKGQLVAEVGALDELRPTLEPLMDRRRKLRKLIRGLSKVDPHNN